MAKTKKLSQTGDGKEAYIKAPYSNKPRLIVVIEGKHRNLLTEKNQIIAAKRGSKRGPAPKFRVYGCNQAFLRKLLSKEVPGDYSKIIGLREVESDEIAEEFEDLTSEELQDELDDLL